MTRNGSNTSLLDDDATFGCDTKVAQHWDSYLQASFQGDSQMYNYVESSGQQPFALMSNWASEDQDDTTATHVVNVNTSSLPKQSPETRVQPGVIGFGKSNVQKNFVRKLFDMLSDESAKPYIYWNSDGKSFVIEKQEEFAKKVLKRYLKTENAQRAQRGVQAQTPQFVFSHQKFQRDSPELLSEIKRKGAEPQDAPPSYETLSSVGKPLLGMPTSTQPLVTGQPELRDILIQMEFERLRSEIASLKEENKNLKGERDALKASLQVRTTVSMPQVPQVPESSTTTYQPLYGGNASNKALELNRSGHLFEPEYSASAPEPTEAPVLFQGFTGITPQNHTNQAAGSSHVSLDSTPIPIRRRLSNAPAPDMGTNNQPAPQQSRGQGKARPSSWYENVGQWLGLPGVGSHSEAGPSATSHAFPQDAHPTHTMHHGKSTLGGRAQPVVMANKRPQY
ncbi:stress-responsive transcription factor hsf1 [Tulasnella sp. 408]|nr:stress-responsive transcription factor hsf1 [Tulasnella sp. 408]